jgi:hypothetical protein
MSEKRATVSCGNCGRPLDQSASLPVEERVPCPQCGSLQRHVALEMEDAAVTLHSSIALKARHAEERKPFQEGKYGHDLHRKTGKWNEREMTVDRDGNRYTERITDLETGDAIRDVDEPLDQHRGHGDARPKQS